MALRKKMSLLLEVPLLPLSTGWIWNYCLRHSNARRLLYFNYM